MPHPNQAVAVRHPDLEGTMVALDPGVNYAADDVLVKTFPQFFTETAEAAFMAGRTVEGGVIVSVARPVEQATAEPGKRRSRGRAPRTSAAAKKAAAKKPTGK